VPARRVSGEPTQLSPKELSFDLKPGEHLVVEPSEIIPVDLQVVEGEGEIKPWMDGALPMRRRHGDAMLAGSRLLSGYIRGVCTWSGDERALGRTLLNPARRPDVHAQLARWPRRFTERWAPLVALGLAAVAALLGSGALEVSMIAIAAYAALANVTLGSFAGLGVAGGVRAALARGVIYGSAAGWEACSRVTVAVFCARGTLLRGEPELMEVEVFAGGERSGVDAVEVLALAAGALNAERNPVAIALRRAARARSIAPDAVRNQRVFPGRGVTAVCASGESLAVGTRSLMLERRISVAVADQRVYELEASGRTVVIVARAGRLLGLCALQDGLRAGARAAVQHLLDSRIEPVLISADTRETCEALARTLDIDHVRAELHDDERGIAVKRLHDAGAVVAVLGHSPYDDDALNEADAAVALAGAGRSDAAVTGPAAEASRRSPTPDPAQSLARNSAVLRGLGRPRGTLIGALARLRAAAPPEVPMIRGEDHAAALVSDDVRDAALALALAHRTRSDAITALALAAVPAVFGALVTAAGLLPPEYAPLAQLLGAGAGAWYLRANWR
jgi:cation transport ATPase